MITVRSVAMACLLIATMGCSYETRVLEATTDVIPNEGGILLSADGLFGIRLVPALIKREVSIRTRRDFQIEGLGSLVYEVVFSGDRLNAEEVFFDVSVTDSPQTKSIVTVDDGDVDYVRSAWDASARRVVAANQNLSRRFFALYELGFVDTSCDDTTCGEPCVLCDASVATCPSIEGQCDLFGACVSKSQQSQCTPLDGWNDDPASGPVFVISGLELAEASYGFDIDGQCTSTGCIDNVLWPLGPVLNDVIRQGLLGGEGRTLVELAGLTTPYGGDDDSMTIKVYEAVDADDPRIPANDFAPLPGQSECCQFKIAAQSLSDFPPQARARAPARVERGRLRSMAPLPLRITLNIGPILNSQLRVERTLVSARVPSILDIIDDGLFGGAVSATSLAQMDNPACPRDIEDCPNPEVPSSLLDLVRRIATPQPDVDLDGDGLECLLDTDGDGRIDRCCDGEEDACGRCTWVVPPIDPAHPESCALHPKIADGYSVAFAFTAVRAEIVGVQ